MTLAKSLSYLILSFSFLVEAAFAGSATWNAHPNTNDWNDFANWTPATVPNGPGDVATFGESDLTTISLSVNTEVNGIVFVPGASSYTISPAPAEMQLTISGSGITNNSGITQNFALLPNLQGPGSILFTNSASAGSQTLFTNNGVASGMPPEIDFRDNSTAENATFISSGGLGNGAPGSLISFSGNSTAGHANLTNNGGITVHAAGGVTSFADASSAGNATLIANGGVNGGGGGLIEFLGTASGGLAAVQVFDNGTLQIANSSRTVKIGSLEGNGLVVLGENSLGIGTNNLTTNFSGTIQGTGSVMKVGRGKLTFANANTYSGGTVIAAGTLFVTTQTGSGTGIGPVQVNVGKLGGTGRITGNVTIGSGSGTGAFLTPGTGPNVPATLTIARKVRFKADGTFHFGYRSDTLTADKAIVQGLVIESGAQLFFGPIDSGTLPAGTVFTAIDNSAATPINGIFANAPDGSTVTVGNNTFLINYEGGDGNDLTLTVE